MIRASTWRGVQSVRRSVMEVLEQRQMLTVTIDPLEDVLAPANKPVIIPITATDTDSGALSYTLHSSNPRVKMKVHSGNPFLKLTVSETPSGSSTPTTLGSMTFELFKDLAPKTVKTIMNMVRGQFYNGLTFHRVANLGTADSPEMIVQGGDPSGNGSGGPGFQFRDEFSPDALFTGKGQLAMANSGDDTNGSQFFITTAATRHLDFNHTIFGQLVRGFSVLSTLAAEPTNASTGTPTNTLKIVKAELVPNPGDPVITVWAPPGVSTDITVTASAGLSTDTRTFKVSGRADPVNEPPVMKPLPERLSTGVNKPISIDVSAYDWEGDSVVYTGSVSGFGSGEFVGHTAVITPGQDFKGILTVTLGVTGDGTTAKDTDTILISVGDDPVGGAKMRPIQVGEGVKREGFVVAVFDDTAKNGVISDWSAKINWGDGHQTTGTISKNASGQFVVTAAADTTSSTNYYKTTGVWPVTVDIIGNNGAFKRLTGKAVVTDAALTGKPATVVTTAGTALSNVTLATFTDADLRGSSSQYKATIDYGDGTVVTGGFGDNISTVTGGGFNVKGTHTYANPGVKDVTVTIESTGGARTVVRYKAYVAGPVSGNVITVSPGTDAPSDEMSQWTQTGSFTDSNPAATSWTAFVDYGDTINPTGLVPLTLNTNKTYQLKHTYTDNVAGNYTVTIVVVNNLGETGRATLTHVVNDVAPIATVNEAKSDKNGLAGFTNTISFTSSDISPQDQAQGASYTINWGDGSIVQAVSRGTTSATHTFAGVSPPEGFLVTVIALDKDGKSSSDTYRIKITNQREVKDPQHKGKKMLQIGGTGPTNIGSTSTTGNDDIKIDPDGSGGFKVTVGTTQVWSGKYSGRVQVYAGGGDDKITVDPSLTRGFELFGGDGQDSITGGGGNDIIDGGGNDILSTDNNTTVYKGDTLIGGAGNDSIIGGLGNDSIQGGDGDDTVTAGDGNDSVDGGAGSDLLYGEIGDDSLLGGAGRDLLVGNALTQYIFSSDKDSLDGGDDDDILIGPGFNATAIKATDVNSVLTEWRRTDQTYAQRVAHLKGPKKGKNTIIFNPGSIFSTTGTILDDSASDTLKGGNGDDLFVGATKSSVTNKDTLSDKGPKEIFISSV